MADLKQNEFSTLLVDLDSLLDTRMATLFKMGEEYAMKAIEAGWHDRPSDILQDVDHEAFKAAYALRDRTTLKEALMTPITQLVKEFAQRTVENTLNSPFHYKPKVIINIHPYKLDDNEVKVIADMVKHVVLDLAVVDVVDLHPSLITPTYAKTLLSMMVMYDYMSWLETHAASKEFEKVSIPDITLLAPKLWLKKPDRKLEANEDPFKDAMEEASPLIGLVLLPVSMFSMVAKPVKKT